MATDTFRAQLSPAQMVVSFYVPDFMGTHSLVWNGAFQWSGSSYILDCMPSMASYVYGILLSLGLRDITDREQIQRLKNRIVPE